MPADVKTSSSRPHPLLRRLRVAVPMRHELIALAYVAAGWVILERLPMTYTRSALLFAHARFVLGVILLYTLTTFALALVARHRAASGTTWLRPADAAVLLARVGVAFLLTLGVHFVLKSFIFLINPRVWDRQLAALDSALFLGASPGAFFSALLSSPPLLQVLDVVYSALYFPLLVVYTALLLLLLPLRRKLVFAAAFLFVWILGTAIYIALPSWGPVFVTPGDYQQALLHMPLTVSVQKVLYKEISSLVTNPTGPRVVVFGCVAAFPSLHIAVITLFALASRYVSRRWFRANLGLLAIMVLGSVVTGYHYLVDAYGGGAVAGLAWWLGTVLVPRDGCRQATEPASD